jgi:hypothetical protein
MGAVIQSAETQKATLTAHDLDSILTVLCTIRGELPPAVTDAAGNPVATAERMLAAAGAQNARTGSEAVFGQRIEAYRQASRLADLAHPVAMRI